MNGSPWEMGEPNPVDVLQEVKPFKLEATVDPRPGGCDNPALLVDVCGHDSSCTVIMIYGWGDGLKRHVRDFELDGLIAALKRAKRGAKRREREVTEDEKKAVRDVIENEGLDYGLRYYSSFSEIPDREFHELRKAYLQAAENLEAYIGLDDA